MMESTNCEDPSSDRNLSDDMVGSQDDLLVDI
jgi:hypothetical protein